MSSILSNCIHDFKDSAITDKFDMSYDVICLLGKNISHSETPGNTPSCKNLLFAKGVYYGLFNNIYGLRIVTLM